MKYYRIIYKTGSACTKSAVIPATDEIQARQAIKRVMDNVVITSCIVTDRINYINHLTGNRLQYWESVALTDAIDFLINNPQIR